MAESGRVTALLGPNGAGKTTFVGAVATLLRPDGGELRVAGIDVGAEPKRVRQVIGLAGQYASVEPAMTGAENLRMVARLFGLERQVARAAATDVLERLGLADSGERLVRDYSGGMRRRLDLGASLVGRPRLLLLDEPTTGLDPRARIELWDTIRRLVADGTDVLLTTQYLEEADQLAQHVVIIDQGRVIAEGTPDKLKDRAGRNVIEVRPRSADGFRLNADVADVALAVVLLLVATYSFIWVFIAIGLTSTNAQAANGTATLLIIPLAFVSAAYVPADSLPGWIQPVADNQPFTILSNALRSLTLGGPEAVGVGHSTAYWVVLSLVWCAGILLVFSSIAVARFARPR